jgi:hypothetical protein
MNDIIIHIRGNLIALLFFVVQLIIDDEFGPLGPGGARALMTAIMGSGPGMKGGPYKLLKSIRIWRSNIGDDGAAAIVSVDSCVTTTVYYLT